MRKRKVFYGGYFLIGCQILCILILVLLVIISVPNYMMKKSSPFDCWIDSNRWNIVLLLAFLIIPRVGYILFKKSFKLNDVQTTQEMKIAKIAKRLDYIYQFAIIIGLIITYSCLIIRNLS